MVLLVWRLFNMIVACLDDSNDLSIQAIAKQLDLPILNSSDTAQADYILYFQNTILQIAPTDKTYGGPLFVDFYADSIEYRRSTSGIKQDIAKAVGCKPGVRPSVLDVTAGLAADAFVLASLGCQLTLIESNPIVYVLLSDAFCRTNHRDDEVAQIVVNNMQLLERIDALQFMANTAVEVDVVYCDPMFPHRQKAAKVKKAMQYFHDIVGFDDTNEAQLLMLARKIATKRVVVKRPKLADFIDQQVPDYQLKGKSVRYDIYLSLKNNVV